MMGRPQESSVRVTFVLGRGRACPGGQRFEKGSEGGGGVDQERKKERIQEEERNGRK